MVLTILVAGGCGTELDSPSDSIIAPSDSTITISPESYTYISSGSPITYYETQSFSISVKNKDGQLIGKVREIIFYTGA